MYKRKGSIPLSDDDQSFFNGFYDEYSKFMFYTARKYAKSKSECEDIVQEAVVRLIHNIPTLQELSDFKRSKYVALTVKSVFLDFEKRKRGDQAIPLDDELFESLVQAELISPEDMPDISVKENVGILRKELSQRDWIVLEGKYILGYTQEELGQQIGVSPDSIRMILCRAKKKARIILQSPVERRR